MPRRAGRRQCRRYASGSLCGGLPFVPDKKLAACRALRVNKYDNRLRHICGITACKAKSSAKPNGSALLFWCRWRDLLRCFRSYTPASAKTVRRTVFFRFAPSCSSPAHNKKDSTKPKGLILSFWCRWRDLLRCCRSYTPTSAKTVRRTVFFRFAPSCSSPDLQSKKQCQAQRLCPAFLVPVAGLEPARYRYQRILSPSRLPIPSHRRYI